MRDSTKKLIEGTATVGVIGLVSYGLGSALFNSIGGTVGGSCTQKGTPCYTCVQAYQVDLTSATYELNSLIQQFIAENGAASSGFTQEQQQTISDYQTRINNDQLGIAKCAEQYKPNTWQSVVGAIDDAIIIAAVGLSLAGIVRALKSFKKPPKDTSGGGGGWFSNMILQAQLRHAINKGIITPESAAAMSTSNVEMAKGIQTAAISTLTSEMVTADLIVTEEATAILSVMSTAIIADAEATAVILAV